MPLRRSLLPAGPDMRLYRGFTHGSLASFFVLDTRQYRSPQPCGNGNRPPCPAAADPAATLLGADQERWLLDALDRSTGRWNILPQQVMMAEVDRAAGANLTLSMDQWPGYDANRRRLMEFFATRRPSNPVVLTGDIHANYVNDLQVDYRGGPAPVVGTELVGTSISSGGDGADLPAGMKHITTENSFVRFCNGQRGYVTCDLSASSLRAEYRTLEYVTQPGAPVRTRASFVVQDGRPGAQEA
jgi:alkaline phosphatase D